MWKTGIESEVVCERCNQENIKHKAHFHDGTDIVNFLVNESVFADILILDEHMVLQMQVPINCQILLLMY